MSFDPKCLELASHFLSGKGAANESINLLAQAIQDAVEDFFANPPGADLIAEATARWHRQTGAKYPADDGEYTNA